jgi:hypothetical protein
MPALTKLTDENISELEKRFRAGATILEAIDGIMSEATYHAHRSTNPEFAGRMAVAKDYITEIARGVVAQRIKRGDPEMAKWWLERKNKKEFSLRTEVTGADGTPVIPILGSASVKEIEAGQQ